MNKMEQELINAITQNYDNFLLHTTRSTKKVIPIHSFLANQLKSMLGEDFEIFFNNGLKNKKDKIIEKKVQGGYYEKAVDIAIFFKKRPISGISVKFVTGNYQQNSNNYFETLMGETANLKRGNFKYANFTIAPRYLPYYNKDKILTKIEIISEHNLFKYLKLNSEENLYHKPDLDFMLLIDTGTKELMEQNIKKELPKALLQKHRVISKYNIENSDFSSEMKDFLTKHSQIEQFLTAFVNLTTASIYGK
jgi:hypothetical protein